MKLARWEITGVDDPLQKGFSLALFISGCMKRCEGCQNPELQDFSYGDSITIKRVKALIRERQDLISSISYVGGDWMYHRKNYRKIARFSKEINIKNILYTGLRVVELEWDIVELSDIIIDGEYLEDQNVEPLFPASLNQEVYIEGSKLTREEILQLPINRRLENVVEY